MISGWKSCKSFHPCCNLLVLQVQENLCKQHTQNTKIRRNCDTNFAVIHPHQAFYPQSKDRSHFLLQGWHCLVINLLLEMLVESFCRLAMDPSGNSVLQKLCNSSHVLSFFLSQIESPVRFLVFFIWLSSTTIWHPQWRGFTCTTSLKKTWNLESPEEDLQICATYRFQGLKGTVVSCTMSECSRFVYYYLSPSSPLPPALTTLLQPAAPVTQAHAWRSGWAPGQMSASPWLVFWASSFFLSCYDNRSLESRICPPWWSTTIWRRIAHTTCIFYGVAPTFPAANVEHFRHLWSKNGYLVNALSFNTQLWWCQGLHPFLKPW